jgi:putative membrane protein
MYHLSNESTPFGGVGVVRPIYYFLLISHITLSIGVVWFVLRALYFALSGQIEAHKKVVKWAYPIWLYVSVTGVVVYAMISPYYSR